MSRGREEDAGAARHHARRLDPGEVMVYLNVLDRFETPSYERAWRYFRETAEVCPDYESFQARCPLWSETYGEIDRVLCTYETAALLIRHGGLNEDLFFEQIPRVIDVWASAGPWVEGLRKDDRSGLFGSVEWLAKRMEEWEHGPGASPWQQAPAVRPAALPQRRDCGTGSQTSAPGASPVPGSMIERPM